MRTSSKGIEFIKQHEGLRLKAYKDVGGKWTTGYGHLIRPQLEGYLLECEISAPLAEAILKDDLKYAENCIKLYVRVELEEHQYDALVSFIYNLGCSAFARSTLLVLLNQGQYSRAAEQFHRWNKVGGVEVAGLTARRKHEMLLFTTGEWNEA